MAGSAASPRGVQPVERDVALLAVAGIVMGRAGLRLARNVAAQSESSIVYGIGLALTERISIRDGAVEQSNLYDYVMPRNDDVPPMHVE
jgi:Molybdopterin-binding domain of aldehyde dehydrogenase